MLVTKYAGVLLMSVFVTACALGKPPSFSKGSSWTFPVVDGGGMLLAPVYIGSEGPFLFAVAPGALPMISWDLVRELGLVTWRGNRAAVGPDDTLVDWQWRESIVPELRVGDLTLRPHQMSVMRQDWTYNGVPIQGVVGSNVFDDTAVWTIDRDRMVVTLRDQASFTPPATPPIQTMSPDRRLPNLHQVAIRADADGEEVHLEIDLARRETHFFPWAVESAGLKPQAPGRDRYVVSTLTLNNGAEVRALPVRRFRDRRVPPNTLDGRLSADFFEAYRVTVNLHTNQLWLEDRQGYDVTAAARLSRWGPSYDCRSVRCASASLVRSSEGVPVLDVTRLRSTPAMELVFAAYDNNGEKNPALEPISVSLASGDSSVAFRSDRLHAYLGHELRVVDVTPFPAQEKSGLPVSAKLRFGNQALRAAPAQR